MTASDAPDLNPFASNMQTDSGRETPLERHNRHYSDLVVILNKVVAGRYRNGQSNYDKVGVLLITWQDDDLQVWTKEVERLQRVFDELYHYEVQHFRIPADKAITALNREVAIFAHQYDGPNNLGIVYYGGHGAKEDNRLKLHARSKPNNDGNPSAFFDDVVNHLKHCDTDILVITDCCYAAYAFSRVEVGRRKFELLTATCPEQLSYGTLNPKSFTKLLCNCLEEISKQPDGFTTSKLYRKLYFETGTKDKPFLFDQSINDWGRISLQPLAKGSHLESRTLDTKLLPSTNGDAYLHMTLQLRSKPKPHSMSELARAMRYLPHVKEIRFKRMHAPRMEIEDFMYGIAQARKIRPLVTRLRKRVEAKRRLNLTAEGHGRSNFPKGDQDPAPSPRDPMHIANWNESYRSNAAHGVEDSEEYIPTSKLDTPNDTP